MNKLLKSIGILHEDEHILVVNKPPRLLTLPDRFQVAKPNLYHHLLRIYGEVFTVHRLDKDTSGVLVFARTAEAHRTLSLAFEAQEVEKIYLALVKGNLYPEKGTINRPIIPHPSGDGRMTTASKGKPSITHYEVIKHYRGYSWVRVRLETGRTHQIRVHMSWIEHPLAVDILYGGDEGFYLSSIKESYRPSKNQEEHALIDRVSLHASLLRFKHPESGEVNSWEAPLPKDLAAAVHQLDRWG